MEKGIVRNINSSEYVLDIQNLTVHYEVEDEITEALTDLSLQVARGRTLGLVGETGAGKTTTALAILRLIPQPPGVVKSGSIILNGKNVMELDTVQLEKIRGNEVSMIFQDPMTALNPVFTVGDQIAESIQIHEKLNYEKAFKKAIQMLETVGIPGNRAHEYPHQFSGGMKQRVVIAIALACNPRLLIADEPTTALDVTIQAQVLELMQNLKKEFGTAMLLITHDLGVLPGICEEVAVMYAGRIVEKGTIEDIFNRTKHPYTKGLFDSLPNIRDRKAELKPIPGLMPDPTNLPKGCAFAPRCSYVTDACTERLPSYARFSDTHVALCSAYNDPNFQL
jgi:peptide/nickel transport system ATP-binding protein